VEGRFAGDPRPNPGRLKKSGGNFWKPGGGGPMRSVGRNGGSAGTTEGGEKRGAGGKGENGKRGT